MRFQVAVCEVRLDDAAGSFRIPRERDGDVGHFALLHHVLFTSISEKVSSSTHWGSLDDKPHDPRLNERKFLVFEVECAVLHRGRRRIVPARRFGEAPFPILRGEFPGGHPITYLLHLLLDRLI